MISAIAIISRSAVAGIKQTILDNKQTGFDNVFCISINGTPACEGIEAQPMFTVDEIKQSNMRSHKFNNVWNSRILHMEFDDILPDTVLRNESCKEMKYMNHAQAAKIIQFLGMWNKEDGNNALIVHCQAGVCRSGAVGKFAGWLFDIEDRVLKANPHIHPNKWVENMLYATLGGL